MMGMPLRSAGRTSSRALFLAISAGCLACLGSGHADAEVISAQFINEPISVNSVPAIPFSGVEPDAVAANSQFANSNVWNQLGAPNPFVGQVSFPNLLDSTGANSGASFTTGISGAFNDLNGGKFPNVGFYTTTSPQDFTISGLAPNEDFTLFLYSLTSTPDGNTHEAVFTVPGDAFDTANGTPSSEDPAHVVTGSLTGVTSATGTITGTWAFGPTFDPAVDMDIHWAGFQLATGAPPSVPEPTSLTLLAGALALVGVMCTRRSHRTNKAG